MSEMTTIQGGNSIDRLTELLRRWASRYGLPLEQLSADRLAALLESCLAGERRATPAPNGGHARWDHEVIERIIPSGCRVLDLGCGNGELLDRLIRVRHVRGQGVELDPERVSQCVARGVPVFQIDLDEGLTGFPDDFFDYVILEETLQTVHQPVKVLGEMLRVGKRGIVSFPNFGYWQVRLELGLGGRMPVLDSLPYPWYDTPNIHLCSLVDFVGWAREARVEVIEGHVLSEGQVRPLREGDNLFAEEALLVVQGCRPA